jgi:alpha-beta hydrolase superfamily lysophospholipase
MADTPSKGTRIPELAAIELKSTTALKRYTEESRRLAKDFAAELEMAALEIEAILTSTGQGNPLLLNWDNKLRARRVAVRAARAADLQRGVGVEMTRLWHDFLLAYAPLLQKHKTPAKTFDFES